MIHARDIRGIDRGKRHVDASDDVGVRAPRSTVRGVHRARGVGRARGPGRRVIIIIIIVIVVVVVVARDAARRRREREERAHERHRRERHPSTLSRAPSRSQSPRASRLERRHDPTNERGFRTRNLTRGARARAVARDARRRMTIRNLRAHARGTTIFLLEHRRVSRRRASRDGARRDECATKKNKKNTAARDVDVPIARRREEGADAQTHTKSAHALETHVYVESRPRARRRSVCPNKTPYENIYI